MEDNIVAELVKFVASNKVATLNSIGLLLTIIGAGLVFRYGMSFQVRTGGWPQWVDDNPPNQDQIELERHYLARPAWFCLCRGWHLLSGRR